MTHAERRRANASFQFACAIFLRICAFFVGLVSGGYLVNAEFGMSSTLFGVALGLMLMAALFDIAGSVLELSANHGQHI